MGLLRVDRDQPFRPDDLARSVLAMFSADAKQRGIEIRLQIDNSLAQMQAETVKGDQNRLAQVLINLLTNALRYTTEMSDHGTIDVRIRATATLPGARAGVMRIQSVDPAPDAVPADSVWLSVAVTDGGPGLSMDDQSRLFNRFAQANPKLDSVSGFGLGLFVSRKIIEVRDMQRNSN